MMVFVRSVTVSEISLKIDGQGLPPKVVWRNTRARSIPPRPLVVMQLWRADSALMWTQRQADLKSNFESRIRAAG